VLTTRRRNSCLSREFPLYFMAFARRLPMACFSASASAHNSGRSSSKEVRNCYPACSITGRNAATTEATASAGDSGRSEYDLVLRSMRQNSRRLFTRRDRRSLSRCNGVEILVARLRFRVGIDAQAFDGHPDRLERRAQFMRNPSYEPPAEGGQLTLAMEVAPHEQRAHHCQQHADLPCPIHPERRRG
jgi:hypothetical protein